MQKPLLVATAVLLFFGLAGCAGGVAPQSSSASTESATPTPEPTPTQAELEPSAVILSGDHLEIVNDEKVVITSIGYSEPVDVTVGALTTLFGAPTLTEWVDSGNLCELPHRTYSWNDQVMVLDFSGLSTRSPRDALPYLIYSNVSSFNGINISTSAGLAVGEPGGDYLYYENSGVSSGVFLLEQTGTYVEGPDEQPIGVFAFAWDRTQAMDEIAAPATLFDVWHEC